MVSYLKKFIEVSWRRTGQPTPVFLPGESYSPRGGKESGCILNMEPTLFPKPMESGASEKEKNE